MWKQSNEQIEENYFQERKKEIADIAKGKF